MRDTLSDSLATARTRAEELVAGWLDGTSSILPPTDILRMEALGDGSDIDLCFCSGTFCWPIGLPSSVPA
jgi:hypothetical protein